MFWKKPKKLPPPPPPKKNPAILDFFYIVAMFLKSFNNINFVSCGIFYLLLDIRKLKAALAAPLDFGDGDNDGDNASEVSAPQAPAKVTTF